MTPADELAELYGQWRTLTEQEGAAIRQSRWAAVEQCQAAKSRLQPRIEEISLRLDGAAHESRFRETVRELVAMEQRNSVLLDDCRQAAESRILEDNRSCRQLRRLQRLFIPPARQNWQSYS